jgi:hypothetical protein
LRFQRVSVSLEESSDEVGLKDDDGLPCTLPTIKAKFLLGEEVSTAADAVTAAAAAAA